MLHFGGGVNEHLLHNFFKKNDLKKSKVYQALYARYWQSQKEGWTVAHSFHSTEKGGKQNKNNSQGFFLKGGALGGQVGGMA